MWGKCHWPLLLQYLFYDCLLFTRQTGIVWRHLSDKKSNNNISRYWIYLFVTGHLATCVWYSTLLSRVSHRSQQEKIKGRVGMKTVFFGGCAHICTHPTWGSNWGQRHAWPCQKSPLTGGNKHICLHHYLFEFVCLCHTLISYSLLH